jgi:hypothetical protein
MIVSITDTSGGRGWALDAVIGSAGVDTLNSSIAHQSARPTCPQPQPPSRVPPNLATHRNPPPVAQLPDAKSPSDSDLLAGKSAEWRETDCKCCYWCAETRCTVACKWGWSVRGIQNSPLLWTQIVVFETWQMMRNLFLGFPFRSLFLVTRCKL